jgi:transcriptional regulator with XRE-family HTH domain
MLGYDNPSTISKIESGKNDITQSKIVAFADALQTTPAYLMGWAESPGKSEVGNLIRSRRESLNLSIEDVAAKIAVSPDTVYRYESEDIMNMKIDKLEPIAKALNTTPAHLMGWTGQSNSLWEEILEKDVGVIMEHPTSYAIETDQGFLVLAQKAEKLPPEEKKRIIERMTQDIDYYLRVRGEGDDQ